MARALVLVFGLLLLTVAGAIGVAYTDTVTSGDKCQSKSLAHVAGSTGDWEINVCGQVTRG